MLQQKPRQRQTDPSLQAASPGCTICRTNGGGLYLLPPCSGDPDSHGPSSSARNSMLRRSSSARSSMELADARILRADATLRRTAGLHFQRGTLSVAPLPDAEAASARSHGAGTRPFTSPDAGSTGLCSPNSSRYRSNSACADTWASSSRMPSNIDAVAGKVFPEVRQNHFDASIFFPNAMTRASTSCSVGSWKLRIVFRVAEPRDALVSTWHLLY